MGKIIGVLFNGDEQILCNGELSTVIEEQLTVEPAEEEKQAGRTNGRRKEAKRKEVKRRVHDFC